MMRRSTAALSAILAGAALALGACGGDDEESASAETAAPAETATTTTEPLGSGMGEGAALEVVESFLVALAADDAEAACDLLSEQGLMYIETGSLQGSPKGGGPCLEVVVESYDSPAAEVADGLRIIETQRSTDGSIRLSYVNAATPVTGAVGAVLRREDGRWKLDSTGIPGG